MNLERERDLSHSLYWAWVDCPKIPTKLRSISGWGYAPQATKSAYRGVEKVNNFTVFYSGLRRFVDYSLHVLVPGEWTVQRGHDLCEEIELAISRTLPGTNVITHLEPLEDPVSWEDQDLDRSQFRHL